ncbi:Serine/threonine-protein kinase ATM [Vitis vinifera]|uniref:Serine/threonine-protein kinase ATM n=1 Tax=Vitis vinifera TaxID=29760 RepID=A0A438FLK9_VITVI|nr:Serine/threonine-protein kinase ATM [Vitis vinifera]
MDESKDVGGSRVLESAVTGGGDEGNGEDIMVEVVGSDVFVDGVGGNSNDESGWGGLVVEPGLEKEYEVLDGGGTGVGESSAVASSLGGEAQVAVAEEVLAGVVGEEDMEGGRELVDGSESAGEDTKVVEKEVALRISEEETDRGLVGKGVERVMAPVDEGEEAIDGLVSRKVGQVVVNEAAAMPHEEGLNPKHEVRGEILCSKVEVMETDAFHESLQCAVEEQQLEAKIVVETTESHSGATADLMSLSQSTEVGGGEAATVGNRVLLNPKIGAPNTKGLSEIVPSSENDQNLKVEADHGSTENVACSGGICHMNTKEVMNSKDSVMGADAFDGVAERGKASPVHNEKILDSKIEVVGSDDADGKCCSPEKDQDMEDFSFSENNQNLQAETASEGMVDNSVRLADSEALDGHTLLANGEEVAAMDIKEAAPNEVELSGNDALVGNLCLVKDQELVGANAENFVEADGDQVNIAAEDAVGEDTVIGDETVLDVPKTDVLDGNSSFTENQNSKVETDSGSTEKRLSQTDAVSFSEGTQVALGGEVSAMDAEAVLDSKPEDRGVDVLDGDLCGPDEVNALQVDPEFSCKQSLVVQGDSITVEDEKDQELKTESALGSTKMEAGTHVGPSGLGTVSDSLEEHTSVQHEKLEMVVQSDKILAHELDGDQSVNPSTVEKMSDQVSCVTAISNSVVEVAVGSQGAVSIFSFHDESDTLSSCTADIICDFPGGNQGPEVHIVSNYDSLPDGDDSMRSHAHDLVISPEIAKQAVEAKDQSFNIDEDNIIDSDVPDTKVSEFGDNDGIVGSLVVDLDAGPRRDGNWNLHGFEMSECLEESTAFDDAQVISDVGQETEAEGQVTDAEQVCLQGGQEIGAEEQGHQATYQLPPESEGEFSVSDLVWGKVRSHPWWPGQIFDPSDASEKAMKYHKKDCFLVAYFGDRTFAWNEASLLKPFRTHFSQIVKQSNSEVFHNAVDCALDEVSRRVELGLACSCIPKDDYDEIKCQIVENTGIRPESSRRDGVDKSATMSLLEPDTFVEYIKALAQFPSGGADQLELVIAKAQLLAFSRLKGYHRLPEFQYCGDCKKMMQIFHASMK